MIVRRYARYFHGGCCMLRGIDHIVILVDDLDQAIQSYTEAGFTVIPGGEHTGGATHNALVAFRECGDTLARAATRLWLSIAYHDLKQMEHCVSSLEDAL